MPIEPLGQNAEPFPSITASQLPEEDRELGRTLLAGLYQLHLTSYRFFRDVELLDHLGDLLNASAMNETSDDQFGRLIAWCTVPARDAVFQVYHFHGALAGISKSVRQMISFGQPFDQRYLAPSRATFRTKFPHWKTLRDTIGHSGEIGSGAQPPKEATGLKGYRLSGRTIGIVAGGRAMEMDVALESLEHLSAVRSEQYRAFNAHFGK